MKVKEIAANGLYKQNPILRLALGTCPTLAVTTAAMNGLVMGAAVIFVLTFSNIFISCLRNIIPSKVRIPAYILIIATFVIIVKMFLERYVKAIADALGTYIDLIVVNCLILSRAEAFANKNTVGASALDGIFMGIGFTLVLTLMGIFREVLGAGALFGVQLWSFTIGFFSAPAGALFTYALFMAVFTLVYTIINKKLIKKAEQKQEINAALEAKEAAV